MNDQTEKYIRIDVAGKDEKLWSRLRSKLIDTIDKLLDTELDTVRGTSIREEAAKFTSALLDYGKSKLLKPGIDNEKTIAEIEELYSKKQMNIAEVRKINAEAESIEISNKIKKLRFVIGAAKAILTGNTSPENLLFIKDIDSFLQVLKELEKGDASIAE